MNGNARYFLALKVSDDVIKFVSVREISKIIVNKSRLEITVLLVSGDKDTVKFQSLEDLERAFRVAYPYMVGKREKLLYLLFYMF